MDTQSLAGATELRGAIRHASIAVALLFASLRMLPAETLPIPQLVMPPFKPVSTTAATEPAKLLTLALDRLEKRLQSTVDSAGWLTYFAVDDLRNLIANSDTLQPKQLAAFLPRYYANNSRCEWPEARDVRTRIVGLITALETAAIPNLAEKYAERAERLQELIKRHAADPRSATAIEIGRQIYWLRCAGQGSELVKQLRAAWAQPNFLAEIGIDTLVPRELDDLVTDRSHVVDNILGTSIQGEARTQGKVSMRLVPSEDSGIFELELRGKTTANTTGVNGPARMRTTSQSDFTAVTRVRMTPEGLVYDPPHATATTRSNTHELEVPREYFPGLGSGRRQIIERFAWKKAEELKPQADAIAARHSEERYEKSMAEYVSQALEKTNQPFREKLRGPLLRLGALYETMGFSTTTDAVHARLLFADGTELGADTPPPGFEGPHSFAIKIHESLLRNAGHLLLRGATLKDRTLAKFMKGALGEIPREAREFRLGSHMEPWSITLADEHPLVVDFAADASTIGVRIKQVTIGGRETPVDLLLLAKYRIEYTPQGPRLVRLGKVQVVNDPTRVVQSSTEVVEFIRRKTSAFFIPEIWFDGLAPPAGGPFDKYAHLSFRELIVDEGWLALGFDQTHPVSGDKTAKSPIKPRPVR